MRNIKKWHYALNITEESDSAKYVCPKTLWSCCDVIAEHNLEDIIFVQVEQAHRQTQAL